jgi:hypothetical protein
MQIDLFDNLVKPILLYGCECWGFGNNSILEKVQLKYLKHLLGLTSCTPNCIVYGETGVKKHDKQDQQGKVAFNERNPHMTQQQEPMARSPGGPQTKAITH